MSATDIKMWSIENGRLTGVVGDWLRDGRRRLHRGQKTIRTSTIVKKTGDIITTESGGYYRLDGPSRLTMIAAARTAAKASGKLAK